MSGLKIKRIIPAAVIVCTAICFASHPTDVASAAGDALRVCAVSVIPALFPFFVLTGMTVALGWSRAIGKLLSPLASRFLRVSHAGTAALAAGLIAGYPTGARTVSELYKRGECSKTEAEHLLSFCSNCGPSFFLGVIGGGLFSSTSAGWYLYAIHVASALIVGFILRPSHPYTLSDTDINGSNKITFSEAFTSSVQSSVSAMLCVCGYVVLFSVIIRLLSVCGVRSCVSRLAGSIFPSITEYISPVISGIIELTSGILALAGTGSKGAYTVVSLLTAFGGFSVHSQALSFIVPVGLSSKKYFLGKILHSVLAAVLSLLLYPVAPRSVSASVTVFAAFSDTFIGYSRLCAAISVTAWLIFLIFAFINSKKDGNFKRKAL